MDIGKYRHTRLPARTPQNLHSGIGSAGDDTIQSCRSFPEIVSAVAQIPGNFTWDAELTVDDLSGHSDFAKLRSRATTSIESRVRTASIVNPARLYLFDMLTIGNRDLRGLPLLAQECRVLPLFSLLLRFSLAFVNRAILGKSIQFVQLHRC